MYDRFFNEFNQRQGSAALQDRINPLYDEVEMLYYLTESNPERYHPELNYTDEGNVNTYNPFDQTDPLESEYFTNFTNRFFDNPTEIRNRLFQAAEDLRDNMYKYKDESYFDMIDRLEMQAGKQGGLDATESFHRVFFMDPNSEQARNRTALLVSNYVVPGDADPWFKREMNKYYANLLANWERTGRSREDFLKTFLVTPERGDVLQASKPNVSTENIVPSQTQTLTPSPSNQSAALAASGVMTEPKILPWLDPSLTRDQAQAVWEEYHLDNF